MQHRACYTLIKLVYPATANANHNKRLNEVSLIITKAEVNEGNTVKYLKPQAQGQGHLLKRRLCSSCLLNNIYKI